MSSEIDITNKPDVLTEVNKIVEALNVLERIFPEEDRKSLPINYWIKQLKEDDILLEYKVIAHTKTGAVVDICGVTNLPRIFDESMLPEAPSNFENAFNSAVVRPALNGFMKHMRVKIEDIKRKSLELPDYNSLPPSIEKPSNPFLT